MKFGDQVLFIENGKEFPATVLSERILDSHAGSNAEPLLSIGYFAEIAGLAGTARQSELVQFRTDVAHESVVQVDGVIYPGGRWREAIPVWKQLSDVGVNSEPKAVEPPEEIAAISIGTSVVTTEENAALVNGWTDEAKANRKWGAKGVVVAEHNSHGLCFDVRHEDGTTGSYDHSELNVIKAAEPTVQ